MQRAMHVSSLVMLIGTIACGSVSATHDAGTESDGQGQPTDGAGPVCDFAAVGSACVFPPHVPTSAMATCFTGSALPALKPAVGATVVFQKTGSTYELACTPDCGSAATKISAQEAVFQTGGPLIEVFCLSSISIPAGVAVTAAPTFDRAIAALASGTITVGGTIDVSATTPSAGDIAGGSGGPGGYPGGGRVAPFNGGGPCGGTIGAAVTGTGGGAGGGGHGGVGGNGGISSPAAAGGVGGCTASYGPLEGGSGGGGGAVGTVIAVGGTNFPEGFTGAGGGGALALIARGALTVSGSITANGAAGPVTADNASFKYDALGGTGGGAGGTIVLAGLSVDVSGTLRAEGGKGSVAWGAGGAGAQGATANGSSGANAPAVNNGGAGGGGGGGYVRIFAASGTATCATIASPRGGCENNPLRTTAATP